MSVSSEKGENEYEKTMETIIHDARSLIEQINVSSQLLPGR